MAENKSAALGPFVCIRCDGPCTLMDSAPTGTKTISSREHKQCACINKSMNLRVKQFPKMKAWWKAESRQAFIPWYQAQLAKNEGRRSNSGARLWEDSLFEESERTTAGHEERERIVWEPFDVWAPRTRFERGIDPKDDQQTLTLKAEFARHLSNSDPGGKKVRGQWCLPHFVGLIEDFY